MTRAVLVVTGLAIVAVLRVGGAIAQTPAPVPQALTDALAKINAGDFAAALPLAEAVVKDDPRNARAWRVIGLAEIRTKQPERAVDAYKKAIDLDPSFVAAKYNLAVAYALVGDKDQAFAWLAKTKATAQLDMSQIATDADLASLRGDSRFDALLPKPADFANPFVESTTILHEWDGEQANDQFGWIARPIGDVDGDGVPDVVTSAPTHGTASAPAGRVYVYSTKTGRELWHADGQAGDQLGIGVEAAGDVNHDGIPDVIASAPGGGYAKVYSGRDGAVLLTLRAEAGGDQFGRHVSGVGDVNHDGHDDVIVGAPANNAGGKGAGRAYVFSGKDGSLLLTLTGEHASDAFGASVAGATSKGHITLIVGAPGAGASKHGRAYIYDALTSTPHFVADADATGAAFAAMFVSVPGDLNGDGVPDVFVSDWSNAAKGPSTGRFYVYSGKDGHVLLTVTGEHAGDGFGVGAAAAGDVDGNGTPDLVVGAWQYASVATSAGRIYLVSGKDGRVIRTYTCRTPGDTLGFDAVGMGDVDGDGTSDFLVTSGWSAVHGFHSGRVFIISSGIRGH
jgi:hypothetical protein